MMPGKDAWNRTAENKPNLNVLYLASGRAVSGLASAAFSFALSLYILDITGSALSFSLVLGSSILPGIIVNMLAGVFVDNHDKKSIMVISDISSGLVVFLFLLIFSFYRKGILLFVVYSAVFNVIQSFFNLAVNAAIPEFVENRDVAKVNSIVQAIAAASNVLGPVLGALAYKGMGLECLFVVNGSALVLAGAAEIFLVYKTKEIGEEKKEKNGYLADLKYLFSYLKGYKILAFFFLFAVFINFMYNPLIFVVLRYISYTILGVSELQLACIQAAAAIGIIVGAFFISLKKTLSPALIRRFIVLFRIQALLITCWIFPRLSLFHENTKWVITAGFCLLLLCYGILNTFQNIPVISYFQLQVPEKLRGRLFGVLFAAMFVSTPFGIWLYGMILEKAEWGYVVLGSGILMMAAGSFAARNKHFKDFIASDDFQLRLGNKGL